MQKLFEAEAPGKKWHGSTAVTTKTRKMQLLWVDTEEKSHWLAWLAVYLQVRWMHTRNTCLHDNVGAHALTLSNEWWDSLKCNVQVPAPNQKCWQWHFGGCSLVSISCTVPSAKRYGDVEVECSTNKDYPAPLSPAPWLQTIHIIPACLLLRRANNDNNTI